MQSLANEKCFDKEMLEELLRSIGYDKDKLFVEDKARDVWVFFYFISSIISFYFRIKINNYFFYKIATLRNRKFIYW